MLTGRLLARRLLALLAVGVLVLGGGSAALADPIIDCPPSDPDCSIFDEGEGGTEGDGQSTGNPGETGGGGAPRVCTRGGKTVPCHDDVVGWFNSGDGCYYKLAEPQPENVPAGQRMYIKTCNNAATPVLLAAPPAGFEQRASPEQLAYRALATLRRNPPAIRMAPDPGGAGLVGLPVWMWTARSPETWGTRTASASDGPISVSITLRSTKIVWNMGDGTSVTCTEPGTPYRADYGDRPSPDCGHTYTSSSRNRSGGKYRVRATTTWEITWSGGGESGTFAQSQSSATTIRIDELQVVTR